MHRYDLWVLGVWPLQRKVGLRASSRPAYERAVARLSRVLQQAKAGERGGGEPAPAFAGAGVEQLAILNAPYCPPSALALARRQ